MSVLIINVDDREANALLRQLIAETSGAHKFTKDWAEGALERAKHRFETSSDPEGNPWKPNSAATLDALASRLDSSYRKKSGALNAKGRRAIAGKKPLVLTGAMQDTEMHYAADNTGAQISNASPYAAILNFGGKAGRGLKVTIPARPFMPIQANGELYPSEAETLRESIDMWIKGLLP